MLALTLEGELTYITIFIYSLQTLIYVTWQGIYLDKKINVYIQ